MDIKGVIMAIYASIMGNSAMSGDTFLGDAQKYEVKAISMTWQCDLPMIKGDPRSLSLHLLEDPDPRTVEADGARHVHVLQDELLLP